jgi:hypothetical protein
MAARAGLFPMLDRVSGIAWERLIASDGPATELPRALHGIAAPEREAALAALQEVRARIWNEGTVFEATPAAVPFLIELALAPAVLVRPPLLQLLAFLYTAEGEGSWVAATRKAVRHGLHDFLGLLADPDADVRVATACLCTGFRDRDAEPEVRRAFTRRFGEEPDEVVRANLIGCLNVYLPTSPLEIYETAVEKDPSLLVRREAAHSIAAVQRADAPAVAVAVLLEAVLRAAELEPLYGGVAWNRRGVVADSLWAITRLEAGARPYLKYLEKVMRKVSPRDALAVAEAALLIAFGGPAASRSLGDLAPEETSLLRALAETDGVWSPELTRMLAHYGLPRDQASLRAYVSRS